MDASLERLPITALKGVGPSLAEKLERLGIRTVQDALFHLPLRYQDRTRVVPMGSLRPGDQAVVEGEVLHTEIKFGRRRMLLTRIADGTGSLTLRFFHFNATQQAALARGVRLRCFGEVRAGAATLEMVHPEYSRVGETGAPVEEYLTPIYPATEGLHQASLRKVIDAALARLEQEPLSEWLPPALLEQIRQAIPLGRLAEVDDIVPTYVFLASDSARHFQGQTLSPNGGDQFL